MTTNDPIADMLTRIRNANTAKHDTVDVPVSKMKLAIADILVDNADPSKTAVETFDNGTATVNTETCKALGLDFDTVKKAFEPLCTQVNEITTAESFDEVESK